MEQHRYDQYPQSDFLRDFQEWHACPGGNGDQRANAVFPRLYPNANVCSYRLTRLRCVVAAIQTNIEQLVHDKILRAEKSTVHLSNRLVRALHTYYGGVDRKLLEAIPAPDWAAVMKIYDDLKET